MEKFTSVQFARLSTAEKEAYLKEILDDLSDSDINGASDSEDEDFVPLSISDSEESEISEDTGRNVGGDTEQQGAELYSSGSEEGEHEQKKPDIIHYYNKYKTGVDTMDQMVRRYTSQRRSSRWAMALFFNILDIASLASYIIYYENNKMIAKKKNERRCFMRKLSEELAKPIIELRITNPQVMRNYTTKIAIESVVGHQVVAKTQPVAGSPSDVDKTGRKKVTGSCYICYREPSKKRRKTRKNCAECEQPICSEHSTNIVKCLECNK